MELGLFIGKQKSVCLVDPCCMLGTEQEDKRVQYSLSLKAVTHEKWTHFGCNL